MMYNPRYHKDADELELEKDLDELCENYNESISKIEDVEDRAILAKTPETTRILRIAKEKKDILISQHIEKKREIKETNKKILEMKKSGELDSLYSLSDDNHEFCWTKNEKYGGSINVSSRQKKFLLKNSPNIKSFSFNDSLEFSILEYLPNNVEDLLIESDIPNFTSNEDLEIDGLLYLRDNESLKRIEIKVEDLFVPSEVFDTEYFKNNLERLACKTKDVSFLKNYKKMEVLDISTDGLENVDSWNTLKDKGLEKTVKELFICNSKFKNLDLLRDYKKLDMLSLWGCNDINDFSSLKDSKFKRKLKTLSLQSTNFRDLSLLKDYSSMQQLIVGHTKITDLSSLLDFESIKNYKLKNLNIQTEGIKSIKNMRVIDRIRERYKAAGKEIVIETPTDFEYIKKSKNALEETLEQHFFKQDVAQVIGEISKYESKDLTEAEKSKNLVFFLTDVKGERKIVKLTARPEEAKEECFANYHFGKDSILKQYIPDSDFKKPEKCEMGELTKYLSIQNASPETNKRTEWLYNNKPVQYLEESLEKLAEIHNRTTLIAKENKRDRKASKWGRDNRIDGITKETPVDKYLISNLSSSPVEEGQTYIHNDLRKANRKEQLIDWGNAGFGNELKDIVAFIEDPNINLNERENTIKHLLETYYTKRNGKTSKETINQKYKEYKDLAYIHNSTQAQFSIIRGDEMNSFNYFNSSLNGLEKEIRSNITTSDEIVSGMVQKETEKDIIYMPASMALAA